METSKKILALDSSGLVASVAVVEGNSTYSNLLAEYTVNYKKTHSQTLLPMLDEIANMTELDLTTIDAIAIAAGPGSFTGLRIGSATAKGLGLALKKPLISIPTVDALAYNLYGTDRLICPIMDARRNQVYTGLYRFDEAGNLVTEMEQIPMDVNELIDLLLEKDEEVQFTGDGIQVYGDLILSKMKRARLAPAHLNKQRAGSVAYAGAYRYAHEQYINGDDFAPEYLRMSQAERERKEKGERNE